MQIDTLVLNHFIIIYKATLVFPIKELLEKSLSSVGANEYGKFLLTPTVNLVWK